MIKRTLCFPLCLCFLLLGVIPAQANEATVTIQMRLSDGSPVVWEEVILLALPAYEAVEPPCFTDTNGRCQWQVRRGMYEVKFSSYTLDDISALAVAEGGLSNFGITVGDADITYAFTFQDDGHVYFDAAPDSAVPQPIVPKLADLGIVRGGITATPVLPEIDITPSITHAPHKLNSYNTPQPTLPSPATRVFLALLSGCVIGGGVTWWKRKQEEGRTKSEE